MTVGIVRERTIRTMARAGCYSIALGVESGSDAMLRRIGKSHTIEEAHEAVDVIRREGIEARAFSMIGFPDETEETLGDTIAAIRSVGVDAITLSVFTPYPGSEMFETCKRLGLVDDDFDVARYKHQSPDNCFTACIPPERFRVLVQKVTRIVDRKNRWNNLGRALFSLRTLGTADTLRRCSRFALGRLATRMASVTSNAFYHCG